MTLDKLQQHIQENALTCNEEFKRLFHGRGGLYEGWKHLTVDSIDTILSVALYFEKENETELLEMLKAFTCNTRYKTLAHSNTKNDICLYPFIGL